MRENLFFALIRNAMGLPLAAGVLCQLLRLRLSPMIAAAMALSSVSVGNANGMHRHRVEPPPTQPRAIRPRVQSANQDPSGWR